MAGKPAEPPHPGQRPPGAEPPRGAGRRAASERELEHTGPLAIERYVKDDGRALILYSDERRDEDAPRRRERAALRGAARRGGRLRDPPPGPHVPARRATTARWTPPGPAAPQTEIPFPSFEIAVFDNRFPAFEAPRGAAEVVVYTDDHDASFGDARARARRGADVGLAPPLRRARRARGRRLRVHLREPRRRGRRHAAPPARPDLRLPVPAARAQARARRRRAPRRLRAVHAARARARRTRSASCTRTTASSCTSRTPRAGPTKRTSSCAEHRASLLDCEPRELRDARRRAAGARARIRRAVRAPVPVRDGASTRRRP